MHHRTIAVQRKSSTGTSSSKKSNTYDSYDDGYDDIYMDGDYDYDRYDSDNELCRMVWMTQWMNLTRIGKYGRQIVKKRSRNDIILDRIRKQDTENMI